jgi:hypothetical protein
LTVNSANGVTASKFVKVGAAATNFLKADGSDVELTGTEIIGALGYTPANTASVSGSFPLGNSLICDQLAFNGTLIDFTLRINTNEFIPAGGPANLVVSMGGVIQRPGTDFEIVQSPPGTNTSTIRFSTPPASGTSHFIVALGGQGSLISNVDWNAKGQILVATGDNSAVQLNVGVNNTILTADSTTASGVAWKSTFTGDVTGNVSGSSGSCTGNAATVTNGVYTAGDQTIGGTKTFSNTISGSIDGNAATVTNGVYSTNFDRSLTANGYQKLPGGLIMQWGTFTNNVSPTSNKTITFPIAFPTACYSVQISVVTGSVPSQGAVTLASTVTPTTFNAALRTDAGTPSWTYYWFAIGV